MQPLEALKQAAIEAKKNLYLPKLIKSANMELCWQGRIIRAHDLTNEALAAKDTAKVEMLTTAIKQLQNQMDSAGQAYDRALQAYLQMGGDAKDLDVGECACAYCERGKMQDAYFLAESRLRSAVFELIEPDEQGVPLPLSLMSKGTEEAQKQAWSLFVALCNAQANYKRACEQFNKLPAWGYVLRAW
jgi:hypothetical protein